MLVGGSSSLNGKKSGVSLKVGIAFVVIAGCCWGTSGTLGAFVPDGASPTTVGAIRALWSGIILFAGLCFRDVRGFFRGPWPIFPVFLAGFGLALYQLVFFAAVRLTGAGVAAIIAIGSSPAMAGAMGRVFFGERLSPKWVLSTLIAVSGGVLLVAGGLRGMEIDVRGVLLALTAGFAYSLEGVGIKMIGDRRDSYEITTAMFLAAGLLSLPFLILGDISWVFSARGFSVAFALSFLASALPFVLFTKGVLAVGVARSYTLALSEPLTAWALSTIVLGQKLAPLALLGVAMICGAIPLLATDMKKDAE